MTALPASDMPGGAQQPLDPPAPHLIAAEIDELDAREARRFDRVLEVTGGKPGPFWASAYGDHRDLTYDNEQQLAVFEAVRDAARAYWLSPAGKWELMQRRLHALGERYAEDMEP